MHKAIKLAAKAHKKQDRDGADPLPYITHPMDVLTAVRYDAGVRDEDLLCAAALHDVVEATGVALGEIERGFGKRVAQLVKELTREEPSHLPSSEEELWAVRNELMMNEIDQMSDDAKLIKLADRYSNLRHYAKPEEKKARYVEQSRAILARIDREICPALWDTIQDLVAGASGERAGARRRNLKEMAPDTAG